ncbi:MAG: putative small secreted protein [Verrucomicrobiales bacterium]|jgi:predicted small secreted protein
MKAQTIARLVMLLACASCLTGCGTASGLGNMAKGLGQTAWNLPRNVVGMGSRMAKGVTSGVMSGGRSAMGMGPRVLSVPAQ